MDERNGRGTAAMAAGTDPRLVQPVRQPGPIECGITCLAMLLEWHGCPATLKALRAECPAGPDGVTLRALADAARRRGFRARAYRVASPEDWESIPLPAIALFLGVHFVVVERHAERHTQAVDPAVGRYLMKTASWDTSSSGVVLVLEREPAVTDCGT
jgi:ABC-type bacteriocin/lantibiotic exporter with double-glycine peptidase domain